MIDKFKGFWRLPGSELHLSPSSKLLGPADPNKAVELTIVLRRRLDGSPMPGPEYFAQGTPLAQRQRIPRDEFATRYGASPTDLSLVVDFARTHGLKVTNADAASRSVHVVGRVAQMEKTFTVKLRYYQRQQTADDPIENYHSYEGFIHIPDHLSKIVIGVFGLDNRDITKRHRFASIRASAPDSSSSDSDPPITKPVKVSDITRLYDFPTNSAEGQTIAILCHEGYLKDDIDKYFKGLHLETPTITDVSVYGTNSKEATVETTLDICIAGSAAPGASIAAYFVRTHSNWIDMVNKVAHPCDGDPVCSVLSSSHYASDGDDAATLDAAGVTKDWIDAMSMAFWDAGLQGVTVCVASGDRGSASKCTDHKAHVLYPASDPWVLSVGGTTVGQTKHNGPFVEYVWNDDYGATGGGISDYFPLPPYQRYVNVPVSLNDGHVGGGVPDVAANGSIRSGYYIYIDGDTYGPVGGTSASAPLWAGYIAVINANLGMNVGFINPILYLMKPAFRDICGPPGPKDNGCDDKNGSHVTGYPSVEGEWDACTGMGSIDGMGILSFVARMIC